MTARVSAGLLLLVGVRSVGCASRRRAHATIVYAVGREPTMPIPLFTSMFTENEDLADQIFLHLAVFKPGAQVTGDNALAPALAKSWHRVDPLTLVFDLDRRARWQDGTPVSAHDVVFTWQLANKTGHRPEPARADRQRRRGGSIHRAGAVQAALPRAGVHLRLPDAAVAGAPAGAAVAGRHHDVGFCEAPDRRTDRSASITAWPGNWSSCAPTRRSSSAGRRSTG